MGDAPDAGEVPKLKAAGLFAAKAALGALVGDAVAPPKLKAGGFFVEASSAPNVKVAGAAAAALPLALPPKLKEPVVFADTANGLGFCSLLTAAVPLDSGVTGGGVGGVPAGAGGGGGG